MKKNYLLLIVIFFFFQHCGYTPIFSGNNNKDYNFYLNIINVEGDNDMNKIVVNKIKRLSKNSATTKFDLNINTFYKKNILTKNKEGKATSYSLIKNIEFEVINSDKPKKYIFQKETKTSTMLSEFELKRYENSIKNNFINQKIEELIYKLSGIK